MRLYPPWGTQNANQIAHTYPRTHSARDSVDQHVFRECYLSRELGQRRTVIFPERHVIRGMVNAGRDRVQHNARSFGYRQATPKFSAGPAGVIDG